MLAASHHARLPRHPLGRRHLRHRHILGDRVARPAMAALHQPRTDAGRRPNPRVRRPAPTLPGAAGTVAAAAAAIFAAFARARGRGRPRRRGVRRAAPGLYLRIAAHQPPHDHSRTRPRHPHRHPSDPETVGLNHHNARRCRAPRWHSSSPPSSAHKAAPRAIGEASAPHPPRGGPLGPSAPARSCSVARGRISLTSESALLRAERKSAPTGVLAEIPLAIASKRNSPALGPGFRSAAIRALSVRQRLLPRTGTVRFARADPLLATILRRASTTTDGPNGRHCAWASRSGPGESFRGRRASRAASADER